MKAIEVRIEVRLRLKAIAAMVRIVLIGIVAPYRAKETGLSALLPTRVVLAKQ